MPEIRKNSADSDEDRSERSSGASTPHELAKLEKVLANNNNENLEDKKHPLQNNWTLWYFKNDKSQAWEDNLKQVCTLNFTLHRSCNANFYICIRMILYFGLKSF